VFGSHIVGSSTLCRWLNPLTPDKYNPVHDVGPLITNFVIVKSEKFICE